MPFLDIQTDTGEALIERQIHTQLNHKDTLAHISVSHWNPHSLTHMTSGLGLIGTSQPPVTCLEWACWKVTFQVSCVCVCACVCACVRACECVSVCACVCGTKNNYPITSAALFNNGHSWKPSGTFHTHSSPALPVLSLSSNTELSPLRSCRGSSYYCHIKKSQWHYFMWENRGLGCVKRLETGGAIDDRQ